MLPFVWFHPLAEVFIYGIANVRLLTSSIVFLVCAIDDDGPSKFMGGNNRRSGLINYRKIRKTIDGG